MSVVTHRTSTRVHTLSMSKDEAIGASGSSYVGSFKSPSKSQLHGGLSAAGEISMAKNRKRQLTSVHCHNLGMSTASSTGTTSSTARNKAGRVWAWGSTGEEQWNPDMEIDVDWKSLTHTGLLPITNDFFPVGQTLADDYFLRDHSVGSRGDYCTSVGTARPAPN